MANASELWRLQGNLEDFELENLAVILSSLIVLLQTEAWHNST